jgi:hypothetical protein
MICLADAERSRTRLSKGAPNDDRPIPPDPINFTIAGAVVRNARRGAELCPGI